MMSPGSPPTGSRPDEAAALDRPRQFGDEADRQLAEPRVGGKRGQKRFDGARPKALAEDEPVDFLGVEMARGVLDAERADRADARADRGGKRGIAAAAPDHQHGRLVERIAVGELRNLGAVAAQGVDPAQHGRMQRAHLERGRKPGDDLLGPRRGVDRQHVERGRAAALHPRDIGRNGAGAASIAAISLSSTSPAGASSGSAKTTAAGPRSPIVAAASASVLSRTADTPAPARALASLRSG